MFPFDPSKMDPKVLMELSQLIQQLPPEQLMKMQSLTHNMMAGFDVRKDMEEFEKSLPPGFRERIMSVMGQQMGVQTGAYTPPPQESHTPPAEELSAESSAQMDMREARLTLLRAVAHGKMSPEEAEKLLFGA